MNQKKITPLSNWPTEAIVMCFRKQRQCYTKHDYHVKLRFNSRTRQFEHWIPVYGSWVDQDGKLWDPIVVSFKKVSNKECHKMYTTTYGNHGYFSSDDWYWPTNKIDFRFEGMYWEGTVEDVRKELAKRPHLNIKGTKQFRKWKIEFKKSLKNK